jgi:hypothetical protein
MQGTHTTEARDCSATMFVEHLRKWHLGGQQLGEPANVGDTRPQDPREVADDVTMRVETLIPQCCTRDVVRTVSILLMMKMV